MKNIAIIAITLAGTTSAALAVDPCSELRFAHNAVKTGERYDFWPTENHNINTAEEGVKYWGQKCAQSKVRGARKKLPGASIGMTAKEVQTKTSWGPPKSVNRTTTKYGTREQWVYGNGNYLYFENGKLTALQN